MQFRKVCVLLGALAISLALFADAKAATLIDESPSSVAAVREGLLAEELASKGLRLGSPIFLRVYKQSSKMELWIAQSPEGLYHITSEDLIVNPRWHRAMNINYPNRFDVVNGRGGSGILIHGKCGSVGCFAIQDGNVEEVYDAVRAALHNGQVSIPVLALPFSFAKYAPAVEDTLKLNEFWSDLRRADILFNRDHVPPMAWICDGRYYFADKRGDSHRHAVHLPGCKPLDKPITPEEAASLSEQSQLVLAAATERNKWLISGAGGNGKPLMSAVDVTADPKELVDNAVKTCNPKQLQCRMLRTAVKSPAICPTKYPRCRTAQATYTKGVECPLKFPRCRFFVGRTPRIASKSNKVKQR